MAVSIKSIDAELEAGCSKFMCGDNAPPVSVEDFGHGDLLFGSDPLHKASPLLFDADWQLL